MQELDRYYSCMKKSIYFMYFYCFNGGRGKFKDVYRVADASARPTHAPSAGMKASLWSASPPCVSRFVALQPGKKRW